MRLKSIPLILTLGLAAVAVPAGAPRQEPASPSLTEFPKEITAPEGTITIYQPQPESLKGNVLTARAAMSLALKDRQEPIFGAFWFTSIIETDDEDGVVYYRDIKVSRVRWPESTEAGEARFTKIVNDAAGKATLSGTVEGLSASLAGAEREQRSLAELKHDPPKIVFANVLSILLLYDGAPRWNDVEKSGYERAINTPYLVMRNKSSKLSYLSSGKLWYQASNPLGPWTPTNAPPADLVKMLPAPDADSPVPTTPPAIVVATEATELIVSDGEPQWTPIGEGALLYVKNTETPWIREVQENRMYVLISGRWFRAAGPAGPWTFVRADQLPASFKNIPAKSDLGGTRVSIAGTEEAENAVLDMSIPKTAAIKRSEAKLEVEYQGDPKFEKIDGTSIARAVNTPTEVLQIGSRYYAVDNGVWFVASNPKGPWAVADKIPEDEIQKIPPSSPAYNVTYVHVYESTPEVVYVGYTPGYMWSYPYYGVPIYGTGWYYPPHPVYYYPRPVTFGFHVGYNPWTGWNFGVSWGVGFMHFGVSFGGGWGGYYRPCCGGFYGGYHPGWGGGYHGGNNQINIGEINIGNDINFGNQGDRVNALKDNPRASNLRQPSVYNRPETSARNADRSTLQRNAQQVRSGRGANDVLADPQGNVARRTSSGIETRSGNQWQSADRPTTTGRTPTQTVDRSSVQRDYQSRQQGASRSSMQRSVPRGGGGGRRR